MVRFPELSEPLKTTEQRLGIYEGFKDKIVAKITIDIIEYKGEREIKYDKDGGEIKNSEGIQACRGL